MTYTTAEARRDLLARLAEATDEIALALALLGAAYEQVDEAAGDRLEATLFGPVQKAYGRAQRTYSAYAARYGMLDRRFAPRSAGLPSDGAAGAIERANEAAGEADHTLADLQDSMLPVEVGDPELRAGLSEVRRLLGELPLGTRTLLRTLGR